MIMAAPTRENLQRLASLLADGARYAVPIRATYDLAHAPDALTTTHTQGKLAIHIP